MEEPADKKLIGKLLKEHNLKDSKNIADFLRNSFGSFIQEALESEMDKQLGYTRYNYKEKEQK